MAGTAIYTLPYTTLFRSSGTGNKFLTQRTLTTNGVVTWSGTGGIGGGGGSVFNNNGTFDIQGNATLFNQYGGTPTTIRTEEHTSDLQSPDHLVRGLALEN